jgi:hypothetical protein
MVDYENMKEFPLKLFLIVFAANLTLGAAADTEDYYDKLASGCKNNGCCLASVKAMRKGNYTIAPQEGCPPGHQRNMMRCIDSYRWCEPMRTGVFSTKEECEQKTGKSCDFQTCDYVPQGKTFEETCGKDFKKGWVPSQTQNTIFNLSFSAGGSIFGSSFQVEISGANIMYRETIHGGRDEAKKIERSLSPAELDDIRQTIIDADLANLKSPKAPKTPIITDQASYSISVSIDDKKNLVSCPITPPEIAPPSECQKQIDKLKLKLNSILGVHIY